MWSPAVNEMDSTISQALLPVSFEPETAELLTLMWGLLAGASMKFCDDLIDIYNQKNGLWLLFGKAMLIISSAFILLDPNIYTILFLTLLCSLEDSSDKVTVCVPVSLSKLRVSEISAHSWSSVTRTFSTRMSYKGMSATWRVR